MNKQQLESKINMFLTRKKEQFPELNQEAELLANDLIRKHQDTIEDSTDRAGFIRPMFRLTYLSR